MTAAAPAPVTRQPVPWDPWCWLEVQIASASGLAGDPHRVGYWQAAVPDTGDERYTVWQADGVTLPSGDPVPSGYGEWVGDNTQKIDSDWSKIAWTAVDCELTRATFATGGGPWDWNASPGNGSLTLLDNNHMFFPLGVGSGVFDDIGVDTPIRVVAHLTAAFNTGTGRLADRVLITGLIRRIEHTVQPDGRASTTINFSEPHVLYGRVNRGAVAVTQQYVEQRFASIAAISDDPFSALLPIPDTTFGARQEDGNPAYPPTGIKWNFLPLAAGEVAADLWTEIARAANSLGLVLAVRLYPSHPSNPVGNGTPRVYAMPPLYPRVDIVYDVDGYGVDTRILSPECSPPATTAHPYTIQGDPTRARIAMCPIESIQLGHDDNSLGNDVSIAASGGAAVEAVDVASIDRWYRHTFQRHDLVFKPDPGATEQVAWRVLERLGNAVFDIGDCSYIIDEPRDFEFAIGAVPDRAAGPDHPPIEPGRWMKLDWGWVTADLRVTRIDHAITPAGWTVTHSYEIHNPVTHVAEWLPSDLPGLMMWLDASTLELAEGDGVVTWADRSGHGHDAVTVYGGARVPTYHTTGIASGPSVRFSKSSITPMTLQGMGTALTGKSAYTLILLMKPLDTSAMNILLSAPTTDLWKFMIEYTGTYFDWGHGGGASYYGYNTPIPDSSLQLWTFIADTVGGRHDMYQNRTLLTAFTDWGVVPGPIPPLGPNMLMGANAFDQGPMAADVAAVLWYDRALTDEERQRAENYLRENWGI